MEKARQQQPRTDPDNAPQYASKMILLTPCVHSLPSKHYGIQDIETRYRKRYLDLIVTDGVRDVFVRRAKALNSVRQFLNKLDFMEVETPVLSARAGGATARPFATHLNDLKLDMFMRVAPELHLKKLVVGGFPRVYEVARVFRNETMDATHNPEFTLIEFYMAFADYFDLMDMTEDMLRGLVKEVTGSHLLPYHAAGPDAEPIMIDFGQTFQRIEMIPGLVAELGLAEGEFPEDLSTEAARQWLDDLCVAKKVDCSAPRSTARLIDKLVGEFIEPKCINPTFITNHPVVMSPLAKTHRSNPALTERFELFVNGRELCNACAVPEDLTAAHLSVLTHTIPGTRSSTTPWCSGSGSRRRPRPRPRATSRRSPSTTRSSRRSSTACRRRRAGVWALTASACCSTTSRRSATCCSSRP